MPTGARGVVRVVDDISRSFWDELTGDGDDVTGLDRHLRRERDVIDHVDVKAVLGDDREALVPRMRVAAKEEGWTTRDGAGGDDVGIAVRRVGRFNGVVRIAREKVGVARVNDHIRYVAWTATRV